jgi:hypothetical protein
MIPLLSGARMNMTRAPARRTAAGACAFDASASTTGSGMIANALRSDLRSIAMMRLSPS